MRITRGAAYVRCWPARSPDTIGKAAVVGVVETAGSVDEEITHEIVLTTADDVRLLDATGRTFDADPQWGDRFDDRSSEIDHILTGRRWTRPAAEHDLDGGGLMFRRTRAPAPDGCMVYVMAGVVATDALIDDVVMDVEGATDAMRLLRADRDHGMTTRGSNMSHILHSMTFDWHRGPWGISSSMHVDVLDECLALQRIYDGATGDPTLRERLEKGPAGWILSHCNPDRRSSVDDLYARYRRMMIERLEDDAYATWRGWEPVESRDRRAALTSELMATLLTA